MFLREQQTAVDVAALLDLYTYQQITRPNSLWNRRIAATRAAIHPEHPLHCANPAMATESFSPTLETRAVYAGALDSMHAIHMREERAALTAEQRHILAGSKCSGLLMVYPWWTRYLGHAAARLSAGSFRSASAISMAVTPPLLQGLTETEDPLGRKCLTARNGGGMTRRHGPLVDEVHRCEQTAGRLALREVEGLYRASKHQDRRVDTLVVSAPSQAIWTLRMKLWWTRTHRAAVPTTSRSRS